MEDYQVQLEGVGRIARISNVRLNVACIFFTLTFMFLTAWKGYFAMGFWLLLLINLSLVYYRGMARAITQLKSEVETLKKKLEG